MLSRMRVGNRSHHAGRIHPPVQRFKANFGLYASLLIAAVAVGVAPSSRAQQTVRDIGLRSNGDAWQFYRGETTDASLPRVLLIGDSIVNGYRHTVVKELKDKAVVDTWLTPLHLKSEPLLKDLKTVLAQGPYAVIHFNIGLHGWSPGRIPEGEYEPALRAYVAVLKECAPKAKLIWGSTTQITVRDKPTELDAEHNPTIVRRNAIAARVMKKSGVVVDDLYGLMADKLELAKGDKFHWKPEARALQGRQVAGFISKAFALPSPESEEKP